MIGSHGNTRNTVERWNCVKMFQQFPPVEARQGQIDDDQIRMVILDSLKGFLTAGNTYRLNAPVFKQPLNQFHTVILILDHEDSPIADITHDVDLSLALCLLLRRSAYIV